MLIPAPKLLSQLPAESLMLEERTPLLGRVRDPTLLAHSNVFTTPRHDSNATTTSRSTDPTCTSARLPSIAIPTTSRRRLPTRSPVSSESDERSAEDGARFHEARRMRPEQGLFPFYPHATLRGWPNADASPHEPLPPVRGVATACSPLAQSIETGLQFLISE